MVLRFYVASRSKDEKNVECHVKSGLEPKNLQLDIMDYGTHA